MKIVSFLISLSFLLFSLQSEAFENLKIKNGYFQQDGKPIFLLGISYFDALSAPPEILETDLRFLKDRGFNALRIWANWYTEFQRHTTGLIEPDGSVNPVILKRLKYLLDATNKQDFIVKLTFSRDPLKKISFPKYKDGILIVVKEIRKFPNVILDLQNETNHCGTNSDPDCSRHLSMKDVADLSDAVKEADPNRFVTASRGGVSSSSGGGDYDTFVSSTKTDFVATHGPSRKAGWDVDTADEMKIARKQVGPEIPILFDEPNRCDKGVNCKDQSAAKQFLTAAANAKRMGAAGWFFHTSAGFRLNNRPIKERLNRTEKIAVNRLQDTLAEVDLKTAE